MITTLEELAARIATIELPYQMEEPSDSDRLAAEMLDIDPVLMNGIMEVWMKASNRIALEKAARGRARQAELLKAAKEREE